MDVASCFETIFPSKTRCKLNKIDSVGFIVCCSFVFGSHCLCLCHGNGGVIYLYSPFTITSLSWPNNRGNIRSSLFPFLMIRSNQPQDFKRLVHVRMRGLTRSLYQWETFSLGLRFPGFLDPLLSKCSHCWRKREAMVFYFFSGCLKAEKVASGRDTRWRQRKLTTRLHFRREVIRPCETKDTRKGSIEYIFLADPLNLIYTL